MSNPSQDAHVRELLHLLIRAKIDKTEWVEVMPSGIADVGDLLISYPALFHPILESYGISGASVDSDIDEDALVSNRRNDTPVRFRLGFFYHGLYTFTWVGKTYATGGMAVGKRYIVLPDGTLLETRWEITFSTPPQLRDEKIWVVLNPPSSDVQKLAEMMFTYVAVEV